MVLRLLQYVTWLQSKADNAANLCEKAGKKRPAIYCKDEELPRRNC